MQWPVGISASLKYYDSAGSVEQAGTTEAFVENDKVSRELQ